jgi:predicted methyltransferase
MLSVAALAFAQDTAREESRDKWQKVDEIFTAMGVKPGSVVADVGAGGGYFTTRLSRAVGESGRVYAIDIKSDVIRRLRERLSGASIQNVDLVQGEVDDPKLPPGTIDAALIVNAYHEMTQHQALLTKLKAALKPNGRLVIVEPISESRRARPRDEQTRNHEIAIDHVIQDARDAGFVQVQAQDPFTRREEGHDDEWMLVLTPAPSSQSAAIADDWKSPGLRISVEEFKRLRDTEVLVVDVRDAQSYRQGHLPGALLITPEELSKLDAVRRLASERRRIITYCS